MTKACPFCAEEIQADAKKCRHCGEFLDEKARAEAGRLDPKLQEEIRKKISHYNTISLALGIPGIILQVAGNQQSNPMPALSLLGTIMLLVGLAYYAKMKGRHPAWCLLAFLSCLGLLILALLGKVCHNCQATAKYNATQCEKCGAPM